MDVLQVRMPAQAIKEIDLLIEGGHFTSRSDVVRHAVRQLIFSTIKPPVGTFDMDELKKVRKKMDAKSFDELNIMPKSFEGVRFANK